MAKPSASIPVAEFVRHFGRYYDEARQRPITLTKHGRPALVVLSAEQFDELRRAGDQRHAFHVDDLSPEFAELMLAALERDVD